MKDFLKRVKYFCKFVKEVLINYLNDNGIINVSSPVAFSKAILNPKELKDFCESNLF